MTIIKKKDYTNCTLNDPDNPDNSNKNTPFAMDMKGGETKHNMVNISNSFTALEKKFNEFKIQVLDVYNCINRLQNQVLAHGKSISDERKLFEKYQTQNGNSKTSLV